MQCDSGAVKRGCRYIEIGIRTSYAQMGISFLVIYILWFYLKNKKILDPRFSDDNNFNLIFFLNWIV